MEILTLSKRREEQAKARKDNAKSEEHMLNVLEKALILDSNTDFDIEIYERIYRDHRKYSRTMDDLSFYTTLTMLQNFQIGDEVEWDTKQLRLALLKWSKQILTNEYNEDTIIQLRLKISHVLVELLKRDSFELYEKYLKLKRGRIPLNL